MPGRMSVAPRRVLWAVVALLTGVSVSVAACGSPSHRERQPVSASYHPHRQLHGEHHENHQCVVAHLERLQDRRLERLRPLRQPRRSRGTDDHHKRAMLAVGSLCAVPDRTYRSSLLFSRDSSL